MKRRDPGRDFSDSKPPKRSCVTTKEFEGLQSEANEIQFKLMRNEEDFFDFDNGFFHPKYTYQIFTENEVIRGYENLNCTVYLTPCTLKPYVDVRYTRKAKASDDIQSILHDHYTGKNFCSNRKEFIKAMREESKFFDPEGELIDTFQRSTDEQYEIYLMDVNKQNFDNVNQRLQALLTFFIEGASFIQQEPHWSYFLVYKVTQRQQRKQYELVAYSTTYDNYQNSQKFKGRISQFLVIPTFQRQGFGKTLLKAIYKYYRDNKKCYEITVEDPSDDFQAMRDLVEIELIMNSNFFKIFKVHLKDLVKSYINNSNYEDIELSKKEIKQIQAKLKLPKSRILRCFELIIFAKLDPRDSEVHKTFRNDLKKKLYQINRDQLYPFNRVARLQNLQQQKTTATSDEDLQKEETVFFDTKVREAEIYQAQMKKSLLKQLSAFNGQHNGNSGGSQTRRLKGGPLEVEPALRLRSYSSRPARRLQHVSVLAHS